MAKKENSRTITKKNRELARELEARGYYVRVIGQNDDVDYVVVRYTGHGSAQLKIG